MLQLPFDLTPASAFQVASYPAGATFGPRHLRNWEFVWIIEGDVRYRRGDQEMDAPEGSVVLCRPGAVDFFRWDPTRRTRHAYFHFEATGSFPEDWGPVNTWPSVRLPEQEGDLLRSLFTHLLALGQDGDSLQLRLLMAGLLTAFTTGRYLSGGAAAVGHTRSLPDAVVRAMAHLSRRLDEDPASRVTLGDLAEAAFVTPEYLCRLFRTATDRSPMETVRLARLDRAAVLLARTNYGVAEVATLCGFESPFHFSRAFRKAFGRSPRELRQAVAEGAYIPSTRLLHSSVAPPDA